MVNCNMSGPVYSLLRSAILNRQQVFATYHGKPREMCPHAIGAKNGGEHVLVYQFGGISNTPLKADGSHDNWRCLTIAELSGVTVRDGPWHTAIRGHSRRETCIDLIDVEVRL